MGASLLANATPPIHGKSLYMSSSFLAETFPQRYKNGTTPIKAAAMTLLKLTVALGALSAASHAMAWDYVLLDTNKPAQNWTITSEQLG
ncbi:hypothetical protein V5O39_25060 [Pseudomonas parakoreensis]